MTDRKKPAAGFWIIVALLAVLVGYPLSFGPACWISSRTNVGSKLLSTVYQPIVRGLSVPSVSRIVWWYSRVGAPEMWSWGRDGDNWVWYEDGGY